MDRCHLHNQTNVQERNHQVKIMHDIYAASKYVFAWLGELAPELDESLSWLMAFFAWKNSPLFHPDLVNYTDIKPKDIKVCATGRRNTKGCRVQSQLPPLSGKYLTEDEAGYSRRSQQDHCLSFDVVSSIWLFPQSPLFVLRSQCSKVYVALQLTTPMQMELTVLVRCICKPRLLPR